MANAITLHAVSVQLNGKTLVGPVSLDAPKSAITCLLGPNGSGKTTLLRAVLGLCEHQGVIRIHGEDSRGMAPEERAHQLSYVPQRSMLTAQLRVDSVVQHGDLTRAPNADTRRAALEALDRVGMADLAARLFPTLSLGEQRRVLIARALYGRAQCMLLDEPDAYLDIGQRIRLFELLRELRDQGITLLVVVHALEEAMRCADHVALLHQGKLVAAGLAHQALTESSLRDVFGVQALVNQGPRFVLDGGTVT
jgi:iron complex transport system ATP-binding protein